MRYTRCKIRERRNFFSSGRSEGMLITEEMAVKVRTKRAILKLGKVELSKTLNITPPTLAKVEQGNYKAPKRIYEIVVRWLLED